jgi:multidrug efflux pump subunit AcrB
LESTVDYVDRPTRASAPLYVCRRRTLIAVLGLLSIVGMPTDIFPNIDIPVLSVIWSYGGLSVTEMQERITTVVERARRRSATSTSSRRRSAATA